jgi:hypothetical protein
MRALIIVESMYGNTRTIAERVAAGLADRFDATILPVGETTPELVADADLLVCGGPTHAHGLSRPGTRRAAVDAARKDPTLRVVAGAAGPGLREWIDGLERRDGAIAAAFDTRLKAPAVLTGRASKAIARRLHRRGYTLAVAPQSFFVDGHNHLLDDEQTWAETWGVSLGVAAAMSPSHPHR